MKRSMSIDVMRTLLLYEPETGELYWLPRPREMFSSDGAFKGWNTNHAGRPALTTTLNSGYRQGGILKKNFVAHRVGFALFYGYWPDQVDHINGNRSDNRIVNLRAVSGLENNRNTKRYKNNTSGVLGVSWHKPDCRWRAHIKLPSGHITLGNFKDKNDAIAARKAAEKQYGFHQNHGRIG